VPDRAPGWARWLAVGLLAALLVSGLTGCAIWPGTPAPDPTSPTPEAQVRERVVGEHVVREKLVREQWVRDLIVIQFGNLAVSPRVVRLREGERVVWSNHSDYLAQVVFPVALTESLQCSRFGDEWQQTPDHLASVPVEGGRLDLLLPCPLAPGSYHYEIYLFDADRFAADRIDGTRVAASVSEPELRLTARLLVQ
jgi:hypothetical protein